MAHYRARRAAGKRRFLSEIATGAESLAVIKGVDYAASTSSLRHCGCCRPRCRLDLFHPTTAPHIEQRTVELAAAEDIIGLVNPVDVGSSSLIGAGGWALASVTDALTFGGGALTAEVSDALPSAAELELLDPAFWEQFWNALLDPAPAKAPGCCWRVLLCNFLLSVPLSSCLGLSYFQ